jgi:hypothetical protein
MKEQNTPFAGIIINWLDLGLACRSEICFDGKKIDLDWKNTAANRFTAEIDFGILNLEIIHIANGIQIGSSLDLKEKLPKNVIFTPLLIPECEPNHVYFCGEKMGRTLTAELPLTQPRLFEGRHVSALTHDGKSVIMTSPLVQHYDNLFRGSADGGKMLCWRVDFELKHLDPPQHIEFDPVTVQCGDGLEILEQYGTDNAEVQYDFSIPSGCGWNSWDYYRWTITEDDVIKNAEFIAADPILKHYVTRIIIDDGWEYCYGEWEANPNFPSGMKKLADRIHNLGFKPGLWFAPSIVEPHSRIAQLDYDMLGCSEGGQPCLGYKCMERQGFLLDPTVKKSRDFLTSLFDRYAGMGYEYFKLDFLHATMNAKRFHDRSVPRCRVLPLLMEAVYRGTDGRAEILGCNYPFYSGNRYVKAVRVGSDIQSSWDNIRYNTAFIAGLFWANKRLWINDPDFALCRSLDTADDPDMQRLNPRLVLCRPDDDHKPQYDFKPVTSRLNEQKVLLSLVLITGGAVNLSDNMLLLNEYGVDLARKVVSAESGYACRPLDLFEHELPVYWSQKLKKGGRVLVINWCDQEQEIPLNWNKIAPGASEVRDFWNSQIEKCPASVILKPHSCRLWEF